MCILIINKEFASNKQLLFYIDTSKYKNYFETLFIISM